ncbi:uncharacterized protein F4807DRAFT_322326 [Annulohypoxylon truncatum]|uniref:uncharacterized protein n=1 Tax=Annulohypoxylon truncatum TaxID=327061 RepID=UPI0020074E0F|nr:uncharacterized protein F4807DRAFT_322326 [Annulohypoxylon truncatum]KAI1204761.1 hypothetical protein F4807DRAFT_322326 [Annulohypoxylon truncatum]
MVTLEQYPIGRNQIIKNCPGKQASPSVVRDWIRTYLSYRGVDLEASSKFLWRGIELYRAEIPELRDAFKRHCELGDWEANIIANDVYTILQVRCKTVVNRESQSSEKARHESVLKFR